jgi:hypothetical protein
MGYREVMSLPVRAFWVMNRNIDRLRAEEDLRSIKVGIATQSDEANKKITEHLFKERGEWITFSPLASHLHKRDEDGVARLKRLAMGM